MRMNFKRFMEVQMKFFWRLMAVVMFMSMTFAQGQSTFGVKNLGNGWKAITKQSDPFDKEKLQVVQIIKGDFTFRCSEINMNASSSGFDSLRFTAELKYIIDQQDAVDKTGSYSTSLGGSDLITQKRYYSTFLSNSDIESLKNGKRLKLAGQFSNIGWTTRELTLNGFALAYEEMCK
jgi:hypothetical protein